MTRQNFSIRQISEELGITRRSVERHRAALGITNPPAVPYGAEEHARILEMLEDGVSIPEIGRTVGRSRHSLWKRYKGLSRAGSGCDSIQLRKQLGLLLT